MALIAQIRKLWEKEKSSLPAVTHLQAQWLEFDQINLTFVTVHLPTQGSSFVWYACISPKVGCRLNGCGRVPDSLSLTVLSKAWVSVIWQTQEESQKRPHNHKQVRKWGSRDILGIGGEKLGKQKGCPLTNIANTVLRGQSCHGTWMKPWDLNEHIQGLWSDE